VCDIGKAVTFDVLAVARTKGFDEASRQINKLGDDANKQVSTLVAAAAGLAPALVPIAAAGIAAGASLAGLGATGILAFKGIQAEMKAGTPIGREYLFLTRQLQGNLAGLEQTAAGGVLKGFEKSVFAIQPLMPLVNSDIAALSTKLGDIGSHVMPGLVSLFTKANPLLFDFATALDKGAASFETWATSSDGAGKFIAYAQVELPKVETVLLDVATAVGHLAQGLAPLGGVSLGSIGLLAKLISAFPIGALQVIVPAVAGLTLGIKGLQAANAASSGLAGFALKLEKAGGAASNASGFIATLGRGVGYLGPAAVIAGPLLGILATQFGKNQEAAQRAAQSTDNYVTALQASHGAISQAIRDTAAKGLQDSGALDAARKLGIGLSTLTDASLGNAAAMAQIVARGKELGLRLDNTGRIIATSTNLAKENAQGNTALAKAFGTVTAAVGDQNSAIGRARHEYQNLAGASAKSAAATTTFQSKIKGLHSEIDRMPNRKGVQVNVSDHASGRLATIKQNLDALRSRQIDITTYIQNVILPTLGKPSVTHDSRIRDAGGPVTKGEPYLIGLNKRPEIFIPGQSGRIEPVGSSSARGGSTRVVGGRLEFSRDAQGELMAYIRDVVIEEQTFDGTVGRMGG
jgi:hypothetical protein